MYEASDIVTIGDARELILGQKPFSPDHVDFEGESNRLERVADIDETDD